ncbi:MAG: hypothetical protein ACK56I_31425, partial [bacterium]
TIELAVPTCNSSMLTTSSSNDDSYGQHYDSNSHSSSVVQLNSDTLQAQYTKQNKLSAIPKLVDPSDNISNVLNLSQTIIALGHPNTPNINQDNKS